jgi:hypothetical protein
MCYIKKDLEFSPDEDEVAWALVLKEIDPMIAILLHELLVGKDDGIVGMITRNPANKPLQNGIHVWLARNPLVQNPKMVLAKGLGTAQLLLDKEKGVLFRLDGKNRIHVSVHFREEARMRESPHEVENGKVVPESVRGANDVVLGFFEKGPNLVNVVKYFRINLHPSIGVLPVHRGIVLPVKEATQVLVLQNPALVKQGKCRYIRGVLLHEDNLREVVLDKVVGVGRSGGEVNNPDLFSNKVLEFHDACSNKGVVDGLFFLEGNLVFINDDENVFKSSNLFDKGGQLVAVEDGVSVLGREARSCLLHPIHRRETGNDENMIMLNVLNGTEHRACFTGLSERDGQDTVNERIIEGISNVLSENNLIREHGETILVG